MHDLSSVTQIYIYMYFKSKANIKPVLYVNELFIYQNLAILEQVPLYLIEIFRLSDKYQENWEKKLDTK